MHVVWSTYTIQSTANIKERSLVGSPMASKMIAMVRTPPAGTPAAPTLDAVAVTLQINLFLVSRSPAALLFYMYVTHFPTLGTVNKLHSKGHTDHLLPRQILSCQLRHSNGYRVQLLSRLHGSYQGNSSVFNNISEQEKNKTKNPNHFSLC